MRRELDEGTNEVEKFLAERKNMNFEFEASKAERNLK
jgi:hypothetical protein